ncbi:MAG: sterol desaturase family protein [Stappiaceae bacterium]
MAKSKITIDEHGQERDRRGEWRSGRPVSLEPLFDFPTRPVKIVKWIVGVPGFLFPWFIFYMVLITLVYFYATPEMSRMTRFQWDWMAEITVRNIVIMTLFTGSFHIWLYRWRSQGRKKKYNGHWMATNSPIFLFSDQVKDNVFWSMVGVLFWSAYECGLWWAYANNWLPYVDLESNPIWFIFVMAMVPFWRNFHFYWIHRLIHWKPLYDYVHYLHHKNVNIGPWSGLAMHPVEHLLYFSCMLIHVIVPSHPLHMMFNGFQTALGPALSHSGFDEFMLGDEKALRNDKLMHYLHHRYHNVNFGESNMPLDKWFGSLHDGTPEADAHFRKVHTERVKAQSS